MPTLNTQALPVPYRVMVVDDDPSVCQLLVRLLEAAGWLVVVADTFEKAKRVIEDRTLPLDLVLVDQRLPDGNGIDLIPLAHERRDAPDVAVMTAYRDADLLLQAIRLGVLDFLYKPFGTADIGNMLRARHLRERRRLGIVGREFERLDRELQQVHHDLADIKAVLESIDPGAFQRQRDRRAAAGGHT